MSTPEEGAGGAADAELLGLWPQLLAAVRAMSAVETSDGAVPPGLPDVDREAWVDRVSGEFEDASWAVVDAPRAQTAEGRALKAAAAMHQLRQAYGVGPWPGPGEAQAWSVLSEIAGDAYVPVQTLGAWTRSVASAETGRRMPPRPLRQCSSPVPSTPDPPNERSGQILAGS